MGLLFPLHPDLRMIPMQQSFTRFLILTFIVLSTHTAVAEPKRVALVIGNSEYESAPLTNPSNDADAMASALSRFGFTVTKKKDLNKAQIEEAVDEITDNLQKGDLCLIFYAGHGLQMDRRNYLVPVGADLDRPQHVKQRCVTVSYLLDALEFSECSLKVVVVDACRNNPFRSLTRATSGLAKLEEAPEGTIVSFSTSPRTPALDGTGKNSPYVKHLSSVMRTKGDRVEIVRLFREASRAVKTETGQIPYLEFDATMPDYFLKSGTRPELPTPRPEMKKEPRPVVEKGRAENEFTNSIGMQLRRIPAGEFMMGSPASEESRSNDEQQHRVRITTPFYAGTHEVTIGQVLQWLNSGVTFDASWIDLESSSCPVRRQGDRFARNSSPKFGRSNRQPMVEISWYGAVAFCDWLSHEDGRTYRLPTEAEWEYMARAGSTSPFPWGATLNGKRANIDGNYPYGTSTKGRYHEVTVDVGAYAANDWGLFDTVGNTWEWCSDWYDSDYYADSPVVNPAGPSTGSSRVCRGGSWGNLAKDARSAYRSSFTPDFTARSTT